MCVVQTFPKCDIMLDNDMQGSGVYLPELDEPEYCNPQNTCLWELHTLKVSVVQYTLQQSITGPILHTEHVHDLDDS